MYQLVPKKKNLFLKILGFLLVLSIIRECFIFILAPAPVSQRLDEFAASINKRCPMVLDSNTKLNNCQAMTGDRLHFNYQYTKAKKEAIDTISLKEGAHEMMLNKMKTDPALAFIKNNNISISATYYDSAGNFICSVVVSPTEITGK